MLDEKKQDQETWLHQTQIPFLPVPMSISINLLHFHSLQYISNIIPEMSSA